MKFNKIILVLVLFSLFIFLSSCDDNNNVIDNNTEETTNNGDSIDNQNENIDESNPDDGINWPNEIIWP